MAEGKQEGQNQIIIVFGKQNTKILIILMIIMIIDHGKFTMVSQPIDLC